MRFFGRDEKDKYIFQSHGRKTEHNEGGLKNCADSSVHGRLLMDEEISRIILHGLFASLLGGNVRPNEQEIILGKQPLIGMSNAEIVIQL